MKKFRNYRTQSQRMPRWDYSGNGMYFITIDSQNMRRIFGKIKNKQMILSEFGKIVEFEWIKSFEIRDELFLDEYIIMPNHLHALIQIKKPQMGDFANDVDNTDDSHGNFIDDSHGNFIDDSHGNFIDDSHVQTHGRASLHRIINPNPNINPHSKNPQFKRKPKSISSFIAGYKAATISKIDDFIDENNLNYPKYNRRNKLWQADYNDHIVRNEMEYIRIKTYIQRNPANWRYT